MREMRKSGRQKSADWTLEVFDKAPFVTMSMVRPDGTPYGLPLNMARKDETTFYFHCAKDGEKIDCMRYSPTVSLSAVSRCMPKFEEERCNFTEYYHSAIAVGKVEFVTDNTEKIEALRLLCEKFLPGYMDYFSDAVARSLDTTEVVRITLTEPPVGKSKP